MPISELVERVSQHRCSSHPIFADWVRNDPAPQVIGALFHQIRSFCDATRPGHNLPESLARIGLGKGSELLQEIVQSEEDHGPHLATMAGHILNRASARAICSDLYDQQAVEGKLKDYSDQILGSLPNYDLESGLMPQTARARAVFDLRKQSDSESVYRCLGTTLALEMVSSRHLIPGENCLVDSGLYGVSMDEPEMHYILEHYGEAGAEAMHEQNAISAVGAVLSTSNEHLVRAGVDEFLDSLASVWDLLDVALLASGNARSDRHRA